jgi:hypothetical protein
VFGIEVDPSDKVLQYPGGLLMLFVPVDLVLGEIFALSSIGGGGSTPATFFAASAIGLAGLLLVTPELASAARQLLPGQAPDLMVLRWSIGMLGVLAALVPPVGAMLALV